jgi:hypothetical protein
LGVIRFRRKDDFSNVMFFKWLGVERDHVAAFGTLRLDHPHAVLTFEDVDAAEDINVAVYPIAPAEWAPIRFELALTSAGVELRRLNELEAGVYEFTGANPRFFRVLDDCVIVAERRDDLSVDEPLINGTFAQCAPDTRILLTHRVSDWSDRKRKAVATLAREALHSRADPQFEAMVLEQLSQIETISYSVSRNRDDQSIRLRMTLTALPTTNLARIWSQAYSAADPVHSALTEWLGAFTLQQLQSRAEFRAILHAASDEEKRLRPSVASSARSLSIQLDVGQAVVARVLRKSRLLAAWNALNRTDDHESVESPAEPNVP